MLGLQLRIPAVLFQQVIKHVGDPLLVTAATASIGKFCLICYSDIAESHPVPIEIGTRISYGTTNVNVGGGPWNRPEALNQQVAYRAGLNLIINRLHRHFPRDDRKAIVSWVLRHRCTERLLMKGVDLLHRAVLLSTSAEQRKKRHSGSSGSGLTKPAEWISKRQAIAGRYRESLGDLNGIALPSTENSHSWNQYLVRISSCPTGQPLCNASCIPSTTNTRHGILGSCRRGWLKQTLQERGMSTIIYYPIPINRQQAYADLGLKKGFLPVTEQLCSQVLSLPIFPELTEDQQRAVIDTVRQLLATQPSTASFEAAQSRLKKTIIWPPKTN